jgi:uncharacterized protein DUF1425
MRMPIRSALTGLGLLVAAGCNNQLRPPVEPHADPYGGRQVYVDSYQLQRDIAVGTPIRSRDQAGLLHVVVPVRSVIDKQLHVQYRARFYDRNHTQINEIGWTDKTLTANTPDQVDANSTSPAAEDFQVDFRYPPGY